MAKTDALPSVRFYSFPGTFIRHNFPFPRLHQLAGDSAERTPPTSPWQIPPRQCRQKFTVPANHTAHRVEELRTIYDQSRNLLPLLSATTMEHETCLDYASNPLNGNLCSDWALLTPSIFNASEVDFVNMLTLTPPIGISDIAMLSMPGDSQLTASNFLGNYANSSEFPFPAIPPDAYTLESAAASTLAPPDLSMPPDSNFLAHGLPRPGPQQDQSAPQSASLQTEHGTERTHSTGQKRSPPATTSASAAEAFTPKRRRGARKKVRTEEELAIRRKNHLQRNRDAAHKCRQKKKLTEAEKREHIAKERHKNLLVWKQIAAVQDELESLRGVTLDIENHCQSSDHKTVAKTSIELIMKTVAKLQDQIDMCNQRRAQISQGLVMQRSFGGYAQQDSIQDGPGSIQDRQSPVMSSRTSTGFSEQMLSPRSTRGSSYATCYLHTDFANGNELSRKGSNDSSTQPDSPVNFNSPPGAKKDLPVEDEAIEIPVHEKEDFVPVRASMGNHANPMFALHTYMEHTGPVQVNEL